MPLRLQSAANPLFICFITIAVIFSCSHRKNANDDFINNPFEFRIRKNITEDFEGIGKILSNTIDCPLKEDNIKNPSFCIIRTVEYEGMTLRVFSFVFLGKCSTKRTDLSQHNQYYVNYKKEFLLRPNPSYGRMG